MIGMALLLWQAVAPVPRPPSVDPFPPVSDAPAPAVASAEYQRAICDISGQALADMPAPGGDDQRSLYYRIDKSVTPFCAELGDRAPPGARLAGAAELEAVRRITGGRGVFIYTVTQPLLRTARLATVRITYSCAGMCGGVYKFTYRRDGGRWRLDGKPRLVAVA